MNLSDYEAEMQNALREAVLKLARIEGFSLYSFNIWTDPDAGVSELSAGDD